MDEDEAYDYKFVKWMIKEKVNISSFYYIGSNMFLKSWFFLLLFLNGNIYFTQKLAAIPVTAFVGEESTKDFEKYIRLCFIKVNTQSVNKHSTSKIIQ